VPAQTYCMFLTALLLSCPAPSPACIPSMGALIFQVRASTPPSYSQPSWSRPGSSKPTSLSCGAQLGFSFSLASASASTARAPGAVQTRGSGDKASPNSDFEPSDIGGTILIHSNCHVLHSILSNIAMTPVWAFDGFPPYCGLHKSLYSTLERQSIAHLERAIQLKRIGQFEKADIVYRIDLASVGNVPVVLIERCELLAGQGRMGDIWSLLDPIMLSLRSSDAEMEREDHRLLALWHATACVFHLGAYKIGLEAVRLTRTWLSETSVDEYTDIMVSNFLVCFFLAVLITSRQAVSGNTAYFTCLVDSAPISSTRRPLSSLALRIAIWHGKALLIYDIRCIREA
jgi:hypothetical protein